MLTNGDTRITIHSLPGDRPYIYTDLYYHNGIAELKILLFFAHYRKQQTENEHDY